MARIPPRITQAAFKKTLATMTGKGYVPDALKKTLGSATFRSKVTGEHLLSDDPNKTVRREDAERVIKALQKQGVLKKYKTAREFMGDAVKATGQQSTTFKPPPKISMRERRAELRAERRGTGDRRDPFARFRTKDEPRLGGAASGAKTTTGGSREPATVPLSREALPTHERPGTERGGSPEPGIAPGAERETPATANEEGRQPTPDEDDGQKEVPDLPID